MAAAAAVQTKRKGGRKQEIIGRDTSLQVNPRPLRSTGFSTSDGTIPDYVFYDNFRRGKKFGFELSSLFARGVTQILTSWIMGDSLKVTLTPPTNEADEPVKLAEKRKATNALLETFSSQLMGTLSTVVDDHFGLGDQYIIVNLDGTFSIPSPDTVRKETDPLDYRTITAFTVTSKFTNATVTDKYTAQVRTVTVKNLTTEPMVTRFGTLQSHEEKAFNFDNPLGVIPVIHLANDRSGNELYGRPLVEPLLRLFSRYDDLLEKALDGAETMSDPLLVFMANDIAELNQVYERNTVATGETDAEGREVRQLDLAQLKALFATLDAKFLTPGEFTSQIRDMLKVLFLLLLEHTRIPEAVWGGELGSARASASEQMETFFMYIRHRRSLLEGTRDITRHDGLLSLFNIWLRVQALIDPTLMVGDVNIQWSDLSKMDAALKFQYLQWATLQGFLTDETALKISKLVDDVKTEIANAEEEAKKKREENADPFDDEALNALNKDPNEVPDETDKEAA